MISYSSSILESSIYPLSRSKLLENWLWVCLFSPSLYEGKFVDRDFSAIEGISSSSTFLRTALWISASFSSSSIYSSSSITIFSSSWKTTFFLYCNPYKSSVTLNDSDSSPSNCLYVFLSSILISYFSVLAEGDLFISFYSGGWLKFMILKPLFPKLDPSGRLD